MNKVLFDEQNGQQQFQDPPPVQHGMPKKSRPKFTLLDDIDQLNQLINGPGANQETLQTQEMIHKNYQYAKSQEQNQGEINGSRNRNMQKDSRKRDEVRENDQKENRDVVNLSKYEGNQLAESLKNIKGPRIIVTMRKINLLQQPNPSDFYVKGLENLTSYDITNDGTRAPTNSMRENEETLLFTRALQDSERQKASSLATHHQFKGHKCNIPNNNGRR